MRSAILLFAVACAAVLAQTEPLASFTGAVREIKSTELILIRPDQDDLEISVTHKTHYYSGEKRIKREDIHAGDRVTVETKLDLYLKPEAVNVRLQPAAKPQAP